jgi:NAD(P)-dependent dehydrogenase (short-subunit alcohol dehydrogenase family)
MLTLNRTLIGGFQVPVITIYPLSLRSTNHLIIIIDHTTFRDYRPIMSNKVVLISGASTGFGALAARLIAQNGNTVYACVREHEKAEITSIESFAREHNVDLRPLILDVTDTDVVNAAVDAVIRESGRIDVLHHNAGRSMIGPAEAFTPEEMMKYLDVNFLGTQRLNRAALPHMRKARTGLVMWTSSSSVKGGVSPFVGPYFAAKAAMDSLAVSYAGELSRWGIETSIIVPGITPSGTNMFATLGKPDDPKREAEYMEGPYKGFFKQFMEAVTKMLPQDVDAGEVSRLMARIVEMPHGTRPYRVHIDPSNDGSEVVSAVADRVRAEMFRTLGMEDMLKPKLAISS